MLNPNFEDDESKTISKSKCVKWKQLNLDDDSELPMNTTKKPTQTLMQTKKIKKCFEVGIIINKGFIDYDDLKDDIKTKCKVQLDSLVKSKQLKDTIQDVRDKVAPFFQLFSNSTIFDETTKNTTSSKYFQVIAENGTIPNNNPIS